MTGHPYKEGVITMDDDVLLDYEERKKLAKWNRILDEVEEWIGDWTMTSMHPPRREDCERDLSHIKPKHIIWLGVGR